MPQDSVSSSQDDHELVAITPDECGLVPAKNLPPPLAKQPTRYHLTPNQSKLLFRFKFGLRKILKNPFYASMMLIATIHALFAVDITQAWLPSTWDRIFLDYISLGVFILFCVEFLLNLGGRKSYTYKSVPFWMDLVAAASLVPDILWIFDVTPTGLLQALVLARASRLARAANRLGRVAYVAKGSKLFTQLIRLLASKRQMELEGDMQLPSTEVTRVQMRHSDRLNNKLLVGILIVFVFLPLIPYEETDKSATSGIQGIHSIAASLSLNATVDCTKTAGIDEHVGVITVDAESPLVGSFAGGATNALTRDHPPDISSPLNRNLGSSSSDDFSLFGVQQTLADSPQFVVANRTFLTQHPNTVSLCVTGRTVFKKDLSLIRKIARLQVVVKAKSGGSDSVAIYDTSDIVSENAMRGFFMTIFFIVCLSIFSLVLSLDVHRDFIRPLERMTGTIKHLANNPLAPFPPEPDPDLQSQQWSLEVMLKKLADLLRIGFGAAGAAIITQNLTADGRLNPMIEGSKIEAIFVFCDIRNFTQATEVLQERVMIFVNTFAEIVHSEAIRQGGSPNKNIGDAFLLVWLIDMANKKLGPTTSITSLTAVASDMAMGFGLASPTTSQALRSARKSISEGDEKGGDDLNRAVKQSESELLTVGPFSTLPKSTTVNASNTSKSITPSRDSRDAPTTTIDTIRPTFSLASDSAGPHIPHDDTETHAMDKKHHVLVFDESTLLEGEVDQSHAAPRVPALSGSGMHEPSDTHRPLGQPPKPNPKDVVVNGLGSSNSHAALESPRTVHFGVRKGSTVTNLFDTQDDDHDDEPPSTIRKRGVTFSDTTLHGGIKSKDPGTSILKGSSKSAAFGKKRFAKAAHQVAVTNRLTKNKSGILNDLLSGIGRIVHRPERESDDRLDYEADAALMFCCNVVERLSACENLLKLVEGTPLQGTQFKMGFGLHVGWAIEGSIGSQAKIEASYLSPHVNISSRLESATKQYKVSLLMSIQFQSLLSPAMKQRTRLIDCVTLVGVKDPVELYTCDGMDGVGLPEGSLKYFEKGVERYLAGDWQEACKLLSRCGDDGPATTLIAYMEAHNMVAVSNWQGFRDLSGK